MLGSQVQEVLLLASNDGTPVTNVGGRALPLIHTGQRLHMIPYVWNTITLAFEPQSVGAVGAGDASAANQVLELAQLVAINAKLPTVLSGDRLKVELPAGGGGLTDAELRAAAVPVSAAALPLPAGAATAARQDTLLTELQQKTEPADIQLTDMMDEDARVLGRVKVFDAVGNVITVAKDSTLSDGTQKAINRGGAKGATAAADVTSTAEGADHQALDVQSYHGGVAVDPRDVSDRDTRLLGRTKVLDTAGALINADDVRDRDVRLLGRAKILDSGGAVIDPTIKAQLPATLGQKAMAAALAVVIANDQSVIPVSDNAGSLTVDAPVGTPAFVRLSDGAAALIGQKVMASSLPVVLASDQSAIPVNGDVDHDAVNTLKNIQVAGHASPVDVPPTAVSANGDRARLWVDRSGAQVMRRRKIRESYTAVFRLASAAARLDQTFTQVANTDKVWATIHHAATATKEVRVLKVFMFITSDTVAGIQGVFEIRKLDMVTPPATGNPAITPSPHRWGGSAAEVTCLYLPGTQGSQGAGTAGVDVPLGHIPFDTGISGAVSTVNPVPILVPVCLYDAASEDDELLPLVLPVGTAAGFALVVRTVGVPVLRITVVARLTEEIP